MHAKYYTINAVEKILTIANFPHCEMSIHF